MAIAEDRAKAVELALSQIEKQFGKGSIVRLGLTRGVDTDRGDLHRIHQL